MQRQMPPRGSGPQRVSLGAILLAAATAGVLGWSSALSGPRTAGRGAEAWLLAGGPRAQDLAALGRRARLASREALSKAEAEAQTKAAFKLMRVGRMSQSSSDVAKAIEMFREAADAGDSEARNCLGHVAMEGTGGQPKDIELAVKCFAQAADDGNRNAAFELGNIKLFGKGGTQIDKYAAAKYFKAAADLGHELAMQNLARMLMLGDGIPKDLTLGAQWVAKSAEAGGKFQDLMQKVEDGTLDPATAQKIQKKMEDIQNMDPDAMLSPSS